MGGGGPEPRVFFLVLASKASAFVAQLFSLFSLSESGRQGAGRSEVRGGLNHTAFRLGQVLLVVGMFFFFLSFSLVLEWIKGGRLARGHRTQHQDGDIIMCITFLQGKGAIYKQCATWRSVYLCHTL